MMEKILPFLILGRSTKIHRVIFERLPSHEKYVPRGSLDTSLQLMGDIAIHRRDDGLCASKIVLKPIFFSRYYVEYRHF